MRWAFLFLLLAACANPHCDLESLSQTPAAGPGAPFYPYDAVEKHELKSGWFDPYEAVVYEPAGPRPQKAPVILFLHGYLASSPDSYDTMLRHIARKGFIVVYPRYGNPLWPKSWVNNAEGAFSRALTWLDSPGHVAADRTRVAFVGHSIGALLALNLAQKNAEGPIAKIPQPQLIVSLDGAGVATPAYPFVSIDKLDRIPATTWMLLVVAEESYQKRLEDPQQCQMEKGRTPMACNAFNVDRRAFLGTPQIPAQQKVALLIRSESGNGMNLRSEHNAAQGACGESSKPIDALDTWGYWKLTVGALSQVLLEGSPIYAFQESEQRRAIGPKDERQKARPIVAIDLCLQTGTCPR